MKKFSLILIFISFYSLILPTSAFAASNVPIKIMTEIFPPFQYEENDKTTGISIDIVNAIQQDLGVLNKIKVYPWSRALKYVNKKTNSAIFSMLRTPEREDKYKWVGPLTSMQMVFFKKKGSPITLNSIEDAKKVKKVGVTQNVGNHQIMKSKGFTNLDVVKSGADEKNIKKLVKRRIDLWPSLKMSGLYNARKMGLGDEIVAIDNVIAFAGNLYIAFNKNTDDQIIQAWQTSLDKLVKNGSVDKILKKYK